MKTLKENMLSLYGTKGQFWLNALPKLVEQISGLWEIKELKPLNFLSYHYVLTGFQNKKPIVLKLGFDQNSLKAEANALRAFSEHGCVKLLEYHPDLGALLMERVLPGKSLKDLYPEQEQESIKIASHVIKKLQSFPCPQNKDFPSLANWLSTLNKDWNIPHYHLVKARDRCEQLLNTSNEQVLLHGDLHHDNILSNGENEWCVIDPKGVVGDPTYEAVAFIRNPFSELLDRPNLPNIIETRVRLFSQYLKVDAERLRNWSYVQAVLATCWMLEDNLDPKNALKLIELFGSIL